MRARSATSEDTPRRLASREPDDVDEEDETIDLAEAVRGRRSEKPWTGDEPGQLVGPQVPDRSLAHPAGAGRS